MNDFGEKRFEKQNADDLIEQIERFDGSASQFLQNILSVQCFLGQADGGAFLGDSQGQSVGVLAIYPQLKKGSVAPDWLTESADCINEALSSRDVVVKSLEDTGESEGGDVQSYVLVSPLKLSDIDVSAAVFLIGKCNQSSFAAKREKLELVIRLLGLLRAQPGKEKQFEAIQQMHRAMETLSVVNHQSRFKSAAMAFCNEVTSQWHCERVSIGFLKGRYVELKAMSHTEDFSRKMNMIQDIESAMEECLDQDVEIINPSPKEATYISRATENLSKRYGPLAVLSLPLRYDGETVGVLTLERPEEKVFGLGEIETIRLTCELVTTRLLSLHESDQWFSARAVNRFRKLAAKLVGPTHTWAKVAVVLAFAGILFLVFGKGLYRVKSPFVLEAIYQRVVPAPFDGYLKNVEVEIGQVVEGKKDVLANLDTSEFRLRLAAAKAEKYGYIKQASAYMRDVETAQAQIAQANADKVSAEINLLNYLIIQANLISPIDGTVVKGDLKHEIGAPVKTGDVLFEIAPLDSLRAVLLISEDEIFDINVGQEGYLATASYPSQRIKFVVERVNPMAEVVEQRNVFKVRVRLLKLYPWMRPGMEGVAKVSVGKRHYVWIWTRKIINWVRMKLWL